MPLFKYRLKQVGKTLLTYIISLAFFALLLWVASLVPHTIATWIAIIVIGLFVLGMVWAFIYWLFVEPFKKERD